MNRLLTIIHRSVALMPHGVSPELDIDPLAVSIEVGIAGYSGVELMALERACGQLCSGLCNADCMFGVS